MGLRKKHVLGLVLAAIAFASGAFAKSRFFPGGDLDFSQESTCSVPPGGGEVPNPLREVNSHVELAVGEYYLLIGTVVAKPLTAHFDSMSPTESAPHLLIDLKQLPWLANSVRKADPYYPLDGGWAYWRQYLGRSIRVKVQAQAVSVSQPQGQPNVQVLLRPAPETDAVSLLD